MQIADVDLLEASAFSNLFTAKGMIAGGSGKVLQVEMRIECQEAVGNLRVEFSEIAGNSCHFHFIHIAGYQEGTGNEEGWLGPTLNQLT
jgi:hypothetical protein